MVNSDEAHGGMLRRQESIQEESDSAHVLWYRHRCLCLTTSNFGKVEKQRLTTPVANLVQTCTTLYSVVGMSK